MSKITLYNLFLDPEDSDLELHVKCGGGEEHVFHVHRFLLRRRSVFFRGFLLDEDEPDKPCSIIKIQVAGDISLAVSFVRYLYTEDLETLSLDKYIALFKAAHQYQIRKLIIVCEKRISSELNPFNVCDSYCEILQLSSKQLLTECKSLMIRSAFLIFQNNLHIRLTEDDMDELLQSQNLNVLSEYQVAEALWKWGKWQCLIGKLSMANVDKKVANLQRHIRWAAIKDVSYEEDWYYLLKDNSEGSPQDVEERESSGIPSIIPFSRVLDLHKGIPVMKFKTLKSVASDDDLLVFSVDKKVLLIGFRMNIFTNANLNSTDWKEIFHPVVHGKRISQSVVVTVKKTGVEKESGITYASYELVVELKSPVLFREGEEHRICITEGSGKPSNGEKAHYSLTYPKYTLKHSVLPLGGDPYENCGVRFTVIGKVSAISDLYCFFQK